LIVTLSDGNKDDWGTGKGVIDGNFDRSIRTEGGYFRVQYDAPTASCGLTNPGYSYLPVFGSSVCHNLTYSYDNLPSWSANNGQRTTLSFSANGPVKIAVNDTLTGAPVIFVAIAKGDNQNAVATDVAFTNVLSYQKLTTILGTSYQYTVTFTSTGITITSVGGTVNSTWTCKTTLNTADPVTFSVMGSPKNQICGLKITNN